MRVVGEVHSGHPCRERLPLAASQSLLADEHKRDAGTAAALSGLSKVKGEASDRKHWEVEKGAPPPPRPIGHRQQ